MIAIAESEDGFHRAAHRPSRRDDIIAAAVSVFAERGFVETSVNDIADAAKVSASSVYYHFPTKAHVFDAATAVVYESLDAAVAAASAVSGVDRGSAEGLFVIIHGAYQWVTDHPDASKILYSHLPGATPESARLRDQHEARHVAGASRFLEHAAASSPVAAVGSPAAQLAARTLVRAMLTMMPLRLEGGMFAKRSSKAIEASLEALGIHIIFSSGEVAAGET
ncbi:hypothetical protein TUM20985_39650 [Mycobacterium antarcticum]|uniref:TetR/AcrR family transcriptional regulator n=1 Tax=unclassified Mycolicibacterium TaxID=2636767 RepID=UPI0023826142|nr:MULTISPECIES: TetR/AcrR family transcriptional regulator [unclassified Mycolicibacterium]BDX33418.1 hypothetical protein TUM20985_39650 [Mycolicibacterium sp. TUM20985]GLP82968.1 hypothetical protein TUM20984_43880 [Mycolicibacterium sp. TUM20984]